MRQRATIITLAAIAIFITPANGLSAITDAVHVHDDIIFIDNGEDEPNSTPVDDVNVPCPRTTLNMRPALVFTQEQVAQGQREERLYVACFPGGTVQKQEIASAKHIRVTQLDNAIFLVGTSGGSADRGMFVMDLGRGRGKQIALSTRIHCLRSVPERDKAMLVHYYLGAGEVRYLELDLMTLGLTLSRTFKKSELGDRFIGVCPGATLSPDFQQVAYMDGSSLRTDEYRLTVMNLLTLQESRLDDHVGIVISPTSSVGGTPPLEWLDDGEIVYRHMPAPDTNDAHSFIEALCVFKRVDVATGSIAEVLQETLRVGMGGGSLEINPLNGELIYNEQWVLHTGQGTLTPVIQPFSIINEHDPDRAKVFRSKELVEDADGTITTTLISPSHQNFAYVRYLAEADPNTTLSVKVTDAAEPIEVAEGSLPIVPAGWIE